MIADEVSVPGWMRRPRPAPDGRVRVAIVGPCASGKSLLAAALTTEGFAAAACAQEHSDVPYLWALSEPDVLIYLAATLATVRLRRAAPHWSAAIYRRQLGRLDIALAHCTILIDTDRRTPDAVRDVALAGLRAVCPPERSGPDVG